MCDLDIIFLLYMKVNMKSVKGIRLHVFEQSSPSHKSSCLSAAPFQKNNGILQQESMHTNNKNTPGHFICQLIINLLMVCYTVFLKKLF